MRTLWSRPLSRSGCVFFELLTNFFKNLSHFLWRFYEFSSDFCNFFQTFKIFCRKLIANFWRISVRTSNVFPWGLHRNFFWTSYGLFMNFLWTFYQLLINFLQNSFELLTKFLWNSHDFLTKFLWPSYELFQTYNEFLANFLWTF